MLLSCLGRPLSRISVLKGYFLVQISGVSGFTAQLVYRRGANGRKAGERQEKAVQAWPGEGIRVDTWGKTCTGGF